MWQKRHLESTYFRKNALFLEACFFLDIVHMRLNAAKRTAEAVTRTDALDSPEVHFCCQKYEN